MSQFPQIANLYGYTNAESQAVYMSNYELVVSKNVQDPTLVPKLKVLNPNIITLFYQATDQVTFGTMDGLTIFLKWFLTLVGSSITKSIDNTTNIVPVAEATYPFIVGQDVLIDLETMHIQEKVGNNLTVIRILFYSIKPHNWN